MKNSARLWQALISADDSSASLRRTPADTVREVLRRVAFLSLKRLDLLWSVGALPLRFFRKIRGVK